MFSRRNDTTEARAGMGEKKKKKKTTFANYIVCISFQSIWLKKTYSFLESGVIWKKKAFKCCICLKYKWNAKKH